MNEITIYHNPNCGTSRNTLAMIRNSGVEPTIIYYLETPPAKDVFVQLIADMKITARELLRKNVEPYKQLIDFMLHYPILINRPIVVTPLGVKLCRPSEVVLDILPNQQQSEFIKEDCQIVIGSHDVKM